MEPIDKPQMMKKALFSYFAKILENNLEKKINPKQKPMTIVKIKNKIFRFKDRYVQLTASNNGLKQPMLINNAVALRPGIICVKDTSIPNIKKNR